MRKHVLVGSVCLAALAGCGLEAMFGNVGKSARERPASVIRGAVSWPGATASQLTVSDGDGNALEPFQTTVANGRYEIRLPSSTYSMIEVHGRAGDMELRAIVPFVGVESAVDGVDLDARNTAETLISEASLSKYGVPFKKITPAAYVGDGVSTGTRTLIRHAFDQAGTPAQQLLEMVTNVITFVDFSSGATDPDFFRRPVLDSTFKVTTSPLYGSWLLRNPIDYAGTGTPQSDSALFDAQLSAAAQLYKPQGCVDPTQIRLMFTVDFRQGGLNGNCGTINRFKWAVDKPGKSMFFVGWIFTGPTIAVSEVQDPAVNAALGAGVPNQVQMYDDGTHGDETAGDGIWTVYFDVPHVYDTGLGRYRLLRIGYKYTWGFQGQSWTGNEEWPGNARILEVFDQNGDGIVYRRDLFGDEATNKDFSNLNTKGTGSIDWTTDLRGCGIPESHEQEFVDASACACGTSWHTPESVGPITVACSQ